MVFASNDKGFSNLNVFCTQSYQPLGGLLE